LRPWRTAALAAALYLAFFALVPPLSRAAADWPPLAVAFGRAILSMVFIALALGMAASFGGLRLALAVDAALFVVFGGLTLLARLPADLLPGPLAALAPPVRATLIETARPAGELALVLGAVFFGRLLARIVREGKLLAPLVVAAALVDIYTVYGGFVRSLISSAPEVVRQFSAAAPAAPEPRAVALIAHTVGVGDFIFAAMFFTIIVRFGMNRALTWWALFWVFVAVGICWRLLDIFGVPIDALPGLAVMAPAVLLANWEHFRYTPKEQLMLLAAGAALAAGIVVLVVAKG